MQDRGEAGEEIGTVRVLPLWARLVLVLLGFLFVGLGIIGLILPVMPGVVFLILAAACFARSSPRIEAWLIAHPHLGPPIVGWRRTGAIPRHAKRAAILGMGASFAVVTLTGAPAIALASTGALMLASAAYILTRPDGPRIDDDPPREGTQADAPEERVTPR